MFSKKQMDNLNQFCAIKLLLHCLSSVQTDTKARETCLNFPPYQKEIPIFNLRQNRFQVKLSFTDYQETLTHSILTLNLQLSKNFPNQLFMVFFICYKGLATKGIIARTLVENLLDNDPTRVKSIHCRFAGHVFPGESF